MRRSPEVDQLELGESQQVAATRDRRLLEAHCRAILPGSYSRSGRRSAASGVLRWWASSTCGVSVMRTSPDSRLMHTTCRTSSRPGRAADTDRRRRLSELGNGRRSKERHSTRCFTASSSRAGTPSRRPSVDRLPHPARPRSSRKVTSQIGAPGRTRRLPALPIRAPVRGAAAE